MKNYLKFSLVSLGIFFITQLSAMHINTALQQKLVKATAQWNPSSQEENSSLRHGNNLMVTLKNISGKSQEIEIPEGYMFTAQDSSKQNMLITDLLVYTLLPGQSQVKSVYGYCCEANDGSPNTADVYEFKKAAQPNLQSLARFSNENKLEGYGVQRAIWCVSDKRDLSSINTEDSAGLHKLISFTGNLMNYSPAEIEKAYHKALNGGKDFEKMIRLEIPVSSDESKIWIVIQNVNNTTLQTVMKKQAVGKGLFVKQFGVSSIDLGKGNFTVRVYSTDRPVQEVEFHLDG